MYRCKKRCPVSHILLDLQNMLYAVLQHGLQNGRLSRGRTTVESSALMNEHLLLQAVQAARVYGRQPAVWAARTRHRPRDEPVTLCAPMVSPRPCRGGLSLRPLRSRRVFFCCTTFCARPPPAAQIPSIWVCFFQPPLNVLRSVHQDRVRAAADTQGHHHAGGLQHCHHGGGAQPRSRG